MPASAIAIKNLTKDFATGIRGKSLRAVDDLSLEIGEGEVFGLLGPNGCGKSTTIKVILGLMKPSAGECRLFDQSSQVVSARVSVGFLPEAPYFYRFLTGKELVMFYARLCGVARRELNSRVDAVIDLVGMSESASRRVGTYSKGMLQRIGLAQAIVHDPKLVILDEPTAGVDPLGAAAIVEIIRELKQQGKTVLLSSHLLAEIEGLCDRVAILHRGKMVRQGRMEELLDEPDAQSFVVEGLSPDGRAALEATIVEQGAHLRRVETPRVRLDALFLQEVGKREEAPPAKGKGQ